MALTTIEREILRRFPKTDKEIANDLDLTVLSVKSYVHRILKKLSSKNKTQAVVLAILNCYIDINEVLL